MKDVEGLGWREGVGDVAEVDTAHDLLRRHVGEQFPDGLALDFGVQVPDGVDEGRRGEMDDALLRPEPAELAFAGEASPELAHVSGDRFQG